MVGFWERCWLRFGEFLAGKYLRHHPEAFFATSTRDLRGEFGAFVALSLFAIPLFTRLYFEARPDLTSGAMWLGALAFLVMAKGRQGFFRRFLSPTRLLYLGANQG